MIRAAFRVLTVAVIARQAYRTGRVVGHLEGLAANLHTDGVKSR